MQLNEWFYDIAQILLTPVLWAIYLAFIYSLFEIGRFATSAIARGRYRPRFKSEVQEDQQRLPGYPVYEFFQRNPGSSLNDVEVYALQRLETVRIVTRISPMLGLIATLVPMGPALVALTENNPVVMGELLRTAFTAVTLALAAASITFWVASVKKRWYAEEITAAERRMQQARN